ncbi:MAG: hypothetical protein AMXMBFR34_43130 [Myxococcaceae bacterium]
MTRALGCAALVLSCVALAQEPAPTVAVFPLGVARLPAGFPRAETEALQRDFVKAVRRSGALVPDTGTLELAFKQLKRTDCDREDACLQGLAVKAETLYGLYADVDYTLEGAVTATGRVVRDDGQVVSGPLTISMPKSSDPFKDVVRVALTRLLEQLKLRELPSSRPVATVTPLEHVGPPPPETYIPKDPPQPPPTVVERRSLRRPIGFTVAGVGGAMAVTGAIVAGLANAGVASLPRTDGAIEAGSVGAYQALRTQETVGWVLVGTGLAAAGVGLGVALTAPSSSVTVTPTITPGGGGVSIQGVFP